MKIVKLTEEQFDNLCCGCPRDSLDIDYMLPGCTFEPCSAQFEKEPMDCILCWENAIKANNLKIDSISSL